MSNDRARDLEAQLEKLIQRMENEDNPELHAELSAMVAEKMKQLDMVELSAYNND